MIGDAFPSISLHNVAATKAADWADDGRQLHRIPESVATAVNVEARDRFCHPSGANFGSFPREMKRQRR